MRDVSFYDVATGLFNGIHFSTTEPESVEKNIPAGHAVIEGHHDHLSKQVVDGEVVEYQPPQPSAEHLWCPDTRRWLPTPAATARIASRQASAARIVFLENSSHRFVRQHALGDPNARQRIAQIDEEIELLEMS